MPGPWATMDVGMSWPNVQAHWVDLLVIAFLVLYVGANWGRDLLEQLGGLFALVVSFAAALRLYAPGASLLMEHVGLPRSFANALAFVAIGLLTETLLSTVFHIVTSWVKGDMTVSLWEKALGVLPSVCAGLLLASFVLLLVTALPLRPDLKAAIESSRLGGILVSRAVHVERVLDEVFGQAVRDTLGYLLVEPESGEQVGLAVRPRTLTVDEQAEAQMFLLVNEERRRRGVPELRWDPALTLVARAHSRDMWQRGYFGHITPEGDGPAERLRAGGVSFQRAGENLALAPTIALAHQGLMESEGHRRNILDPQFGRIGIGVIDGGVFGKMVTQNFAD